MSNNELSSLQVVDSYFGELLLNDKPQKDMISVWQNIPMHDDGFKVFYFEIFSIIYAVPLSQLGNIYTLKEYKQLDLAPDWYMGSQVENTLKLGIVDMTKWAMPERIIDGSHKNYQYIILLAQSQWGLACDQILDVEIVSNEQINWRQNAGKRPWIAGMINEKKAVLLHVDALISMLNQSIDTNETNQD